mmetsp:Transcript_4940/g.12418  ORF Transcript_4940/g.12418 Transcript_4940/m.12418 type:complete len:797 (+) Transcript_4940:174-2564(+)|eukprot:CAMPEP_0181100864 /NCGR_PEP_ID=MMETSP1071-20121207/13430_1 /TAXON_ID=35127 /ORGANISM="Thalassiosira sp., Strain NH16" /LENGTH=796 /DNA_ID=CAMNT_0023183641 /DNA_START=124 /DNA_END=2514 /DNA_ORIENTATION=+
MSASRHRKRAPFGEAPADIGNRNNRAMTPTRTHIPPPSSLMGKRKKDLASSLPPKALPRAPMSSILVKNGARSKSRQRQRADSEPASHHEQESSVSTVDAHINPSKDATRARMYKAAAYEAKIRIATQEQQIEALQAELAEVKLFQELEQNDGSDSGEREKKSKDDADLIEALAQELETVENDLIEAHKRAGELEKNLTETRSKSEIDILSATQSSAMEKEQWATEKRQWEEREAELNEQLERQRRELSNAKKDTNKDISMMKELFNESQERVGELEKDLIESRSKSERLSFSETQSSTMEKAQWERREAVLNDQLERQRKELSKAKKDAIEGISIMKELDGALRAARAERDDARSQVSTMRDEMQLKVQDDTERKVVIKELGMTLVSMQNERDKALAKVSQVSTLRCEMEQKMQDEVKELEMKLVSMQNERDENSSQCKILEKSNRDMQNALVAAQSQTGKKIDQMKQAVLESQMREEKLKHDHESLVNSYKQKIKESLEMESARVELEDLHSRKMDEMKVNMNDLSEKLTNAQTKNRAYEVVESKYISEIASLKDSVIELEINTKRQLQEAPDDELVSRLQMDKVKLEAEKADLLDKLQRGLEIHEHIKMDLESKVLELQNTETLKKDYTSAVELTISRGKKIQTLEKDVEAYRSQLAKAVKKLDKKSQPSSADKHLQAEVSSLRTKTWEAEATISALQEKLTLQLSKASHTKNLEGDLVSARKENDTLHLKISHLEEALKDMQVALKTVSSRKLTTPSSSPIPKEHNERRNEIEKNALVDYFSQRMQTQKEDI